MGAALIQAVTETLPGWWALVLYLVPAGIALGLIVAFIVRRRRRHRQVGADDERG